MDKNRILLHQRLPLSKRRNIYGYNKNMPERCMNILVAERNEKAEGDFLTTQGEYRLQDNSIDNVDVPELTTGNLV
jgi:hypothetical protein